MDRKTLVDVVKKLNETELTDPIDVKVKEEELKELFGQAVDSVLDNDEYGDTEDERQKKLPEAVRAVYKELFLSEAEVARIPACAAHSAAEATSVEEDRFNLRK